MTTDDTGQTGPSWPWVAVLLLALLGALWSGYGAHLSDHARIDHDWHTMHLVDALHVEQEVERGHWTAVRTPWLQAGSPLFGVATKPFSYPPFFLGVRAFGPALGMNVLLLLHLVVGGLGTAWLVRRLGAGRPAALACALLFVLSRFPAMGFVATPFAFGYAVAWWPWFLGCLLDLLEDRRPWRAGAWLGVLGAAQWHAGGEPSFYWLVCFSLAFVLPWLLRRRGAGAWGRLAGGALLALVVLLGLGAPRLLPELSWLGSVGRGEPLSVEATRDSAIEEAVAASSTDSHLLVLGGQLVEQYSGAGGIALAVGALLGLLTSVRRRAFWGVLLGTAVGYVLASGAVHDWAYEWLPGYDRMRRPTRFVQVFGFGAILLAAFGFDALQRWRPLASRTVLLGAALVVLVLWDTGRLGPRESDQELGPVGPRTAMTAAQLGPVLAEKGRFRMHGETHREQPGWVSLRIETTGGALGGESTAPAELEELLPQFLTARELELEARGALDVLNTRFLSSSLPLDQEDGRPRPGFGHLERVFGPARLAPGVREALQRAEVPRLWLYRRHGARPRLARVAAPTLVVGEPEARRAAVVARLRSEDFQAGSECMVELEGDPEALAAELGAGAGSILFVGADTEDPALRRWTAAHGGRVLTEQDGLRWWSTELADQRVVPLEDRRVASTARRIQLEVEGVAGWLVLAEPVDLQEGWTVEVDGAPARTYRADALATALYLPPGARRVVMAYAPPGRSLGILFALATSVALLAGGLRALRR